MTAPAETADIYAPGGLAARRFPLAPRPKPPCRPLGQRLDRAAWLASQAQVAGAEATLRAAEACNLAALIASDCAMPDLARDLCWLQFHACTAAGPYGETGAKLALQPLVNLARLSIRDGDGDGGYQVLQSLHDAARSPQGQAVIDGRAVSIGTLIAPGSTRETLVQWLWAVLLSDGLRALCRAGHWTDALRQAQEHDGIGQRLLDGRQAAILALAAAGRNEEAGQLLQQTDATEPWEQAVAACLRALTQQHPGKTASADDAAELTRAYLALDETSHVMFAARLGLTVAELTTHDSRPVVTKVTRIAVQSRDAYVAREILTSPARPPIPTETLTQLHGTVRLSGLSQPLTAEQSRRLTSSVQSAAAALAAELASGS